MNNDNAALIESLRRHMNAVVQLNRESAKKRESADKLLERVGHN